MRYNKIIISTLVFVSILCALCGESFSQSYSTSSQIGKEDIKWFDGVNQTFTRRTSTGGQLTLTRLGDAVDVKALYGYLGQNDSAIGAALTAVSSNPAVLDLCPGTWTISNNVTIPSNVTLKAQPGVFISVASGKTLSINGPLFFGRSQVFTGAGSVILGGMAVANLIDPAWWGAKGDGATDDTAAIQAADTAIAAGGAQGVISLSAATYLVSTINQDPTVSFLGAGINITRIKMKNGANASAVIQTNGFSGLTGGTSTAGSFRNFISDMTVDGNKANNSAGRGIQVYGKAFLLRNLSIESAYSDGLYTEYGGADNFTTPAGTLEARLSNLSIQQNGGSGWIDKGPHDSIAQSVVIFNNGVWGFDDQSPVHLSGMNTYLNPSGGIWVHGNGGISGTDVIGSTATGVGMLIDTGTGGCGISSGSFGGPIALEINSYNHSIHGIVANSTTAAVKFGAYGAANLNLAMWENSGYWFDLSSGGGASSSVTAQAYSIAGTLFNGTPNAWGTWAVNGIDTAHSYTQPALNVHDVTGSRAISVVYQNLTGKPMWVSAQYGVGTTGLSNFSLQSLIDTASTPSVYGPASILANSASEKIVVQFLVPPNYYYDISYSGTPGTGWNLISWLEIY